MNFIPHQYQAYCIDRVIRDAHVALLLDMGLGKTVITLSAIFVLKYQMFSIHRALVIAPKRVAESTWINEVRKWDHLSHLRMSLVTGAAPQRKRALANRADVYVIGRDNVKWLVDYQRNDWAFDMVVVDELSGFKDPSSQRFKSLRAVLPRIRRVIGLTGTPAPNGLMDLWPQMYLLDQGQRLGKTITGYRERYFSHNAYTHEFKAKQGADAAVHDAIKDICVSMSAADYLTMPDCMTIDVPVVLDPAAVKAYKTLEKQMILELPEGEVSATSAVALSNKLLQLCNGAVYGEERAEYLIHDCKLDALQEAVEGLRGQHAIVFYGFRHDVPRIKGMIAKNFAGLRVQELRTPADEAAWNRGGIDILLTHPASSAYGLNLQDGGHHMIWFGLTWSLQLYQQAVARLHRQGQKHPVIVHRLIVQGGLDEAVAAALEGKRDTQDALLYALRARIEAVRSE